MAGSKAGGLRAASTNKAKYGSSYYADIGCMGGSVNRRETRLFYVDRELARSAGKAGGTKSRRTKKEA